MHYWYDDAPCLVSTALIVGTIIQIYRLFIIYGSNFLVIIFPILIYIAAFSEYPVAIRVNSPSHSPVVLAVLELVSSFSPGGFFFNGSAVNFGTPYYSLTIGLNVIVTALICYRLLSLSKLVKHTMGPENAKLYTSVASILIESAAPYSITGIIFLVPYARGDLVSVALGQVWAKCTVRHPLMFESLQITSLIFAHQCLAPQLIVLRVVSDRAWTRDTIDQVHTGGFSFSTRSRHTGTTNEVSMNQLSKRGTDVTQGSTLAESYTKKGNSAATLAEVPEV